ncbi:hypothetical protein AOT82_2673 [Psychrobacter sp. AntiMn-1]|jgi:hypothetical protein|nr:hypothetical protein AOT82_2673 [Psychrobacter sp. AntiMn-1]
MNFKDQLQSATLITLVTKWSPFGHRVLGHRFSEDRAHAKKLVIHTLSKIMPIINN